MDNLTEELLLSAAALKASPGWRRFREWWEARRDLALQEIRSVDPLEPYDGQASGAHRIIRAQQVLDDFDAIFGLEDGVGEWEPEVSAPSDSVFTYNRG